ncbi:MAG: hypothetical protein AN188_01542 [Candidatus Methanofastidiosum methylothiophilum]|uniref:Type I restriction modification DNA specificity domain protein n=1 Tax=Candidatus Methanofastidiosum methylothiophilum TaxID=1705564 RepID=A0A150J6K3_9EURY|nr:MAG: hypothetical protein AN188_01542 [Candidatus Methanofastidiosum methylthiophilus]OQC17180.1 MAG: hypothetical protein BWX72_00451 [Firmicutes bacterium ADurb.Bin080]
MKNNNTLKSIVFDSKTMTPTTNNIPPQGYKMTELGPLPEEWEVTRLGEVAEVNYGKA